MILFATVAIGTAQGAAASDRPCLRALVPLGMGAIPNIRNFAPAKCPDRPMTPLRYDPATRATLATRAIDIGDVVHIWPDARPDIVQPGDILTLAAEAGPVRVEREVRALQSAHPGQRLFVRDGEGRIISVRYENIAR